MPNYNTLHKDINLTEKENGYWDYETQYGDYHIVDGKQSLRNGLIIACLTSWNYLNRKGNPTYETFGNRAYEELKKKKSAMVEYKIQQYFTEVLQRMRRVNRIIDLQVKSNPYNPNDYLVYFTVEAINDEIAEGKFSISTTQNLSPSRIAITQEGTSATPNNPIYFKAKIETEYDSNLEDEIIYMYHITNEGKEEFVKSYKAKDTIPVYPYNSLGYEKIIFKFHGNNLFSSSESDIYEFLSIPFYFQIDHNQHLQLIKNKDYHITAWLGSIIHDTTELIYDENEPQKIYLVPNGDDYDKYNYTNGVYLKETETVYHLLNKPDDISIGDVRLYVEDRNQNLYIIDKLSRDETHHIFATL